MPVLNTLVRESSDLPKFNQTHNATMFSSVMESRELHFASLGLEGFRSRLGFGLEISLFYLFVSRHEVHSMNTHTLQNAG